MIVVNNTGVAALSATLGIYDARDGSSVGTYTTAPIPPGGQAVLSVSDIESGAGVSPSSGMYHYVIKAEGAFTGFLQHLVENVQAGVTTDMSAVCAMEASLSTATKSPLRSGAVFSTAQQTSQSFLRFYNGDTNAGEITVSLIDYDNGQALGQWTSPSIPAGAEHQFSISGIETGTGETFTRPDFYSVSVESSVTGYFQHVLWRAADGTLTNLSTCSAAVTANQTILSGVHTSLLDNNYPSNVAITNTGAATASVTLGIYDARDGSHLGDYATPQIPANGTVLISAAMMESAVGTPTDDLFHYVIQADEQFTGYLQHLVNNVQAGVTTDMTTACAMKAQPTAETYVSISQFPKFGAPCESGQTTLDGQLMVCSSEGKLRYALHEDIPDAPSGGYVERPAWYPPLSAVFPTNNPPSCPTSGGVTFTSMVMPVDELTTTIPQGRTQLTHVTPTDHGYIGIAANDIPLEERTEDDYVSVYAPADGKVIEISELQPERIRMVIAHGCDVYTVFIELNRLRGVLGEYEEELLETGRVSSQISLLAGDILGEHRDGALDFEVHDGNTWLTGFEAPFSYVGEAWKPYTVDPLDYFTPELANVLEATLPRDEQPRWGKIDHDIASTASGSWFLSGTLGYSGRSVEDVSAATETLQGGAIPGKNTYVWSHLSIAQHWILPSYWVFSTGWWEDEAGDTSQSCMDLTGGNPKPSELTPEDGTKVYLLRKLLNASNAPDGNLCDPFVIHGIVAVQVNGNETLSVEPLPGAENTEDFPGFSDAVRTYRR